MRAFVTGASGFIGSQLVDHLVRDGHVVSCLIRPGSPRDHLPRGVRLVAGSLDDESILAAGVTDADAVFHVAGKTRGTGEALARANVEGTRHLVHALRSSGKRDAVLLYVSSLAAAGSCAQPPGRNENMPAAPVSGYGRSKLAGEGVVLEEATRRPVVVIRPPVVYGPRDKGHLALFRCAARGIIPQFRRSFSMSAVHVDDLVGAMLLAVRQSSTGGRVYFVSDGAAHDWNELAECAATAVGRAGRRVIVPRPILHGICLWNGLRLNLGAKPSFLGPDKWLELCEPGWLCDCGKAMRELGYQPHFSLDEGFRATAEWYRSAGWL